MAYFTYTLLANRKNYERVIRQITERSRHSNTAQAKDLKWYITKPLPFYSLKTKIQRLKDGLRVMNGKSFAVHYKEDE
jgi:hypothetical protein